MRVINFYVFSYAFTISFNSSRKEPRAMIGILIVCIFAKNVIGNDTDTILAEHYKYFKSLGEQNKLVPLYEGLQESASIKNLESTAHMSLHNNLEHDSNTSLEAPLAPELRESQVTINEVYEATPINGHNETEEDNRRFLQWLKKFFRSKILRRHKKTLSPLTNTEPTTAELTVAKKSTAPSTNVSQSESDNLTRRMGWLSKLFNIPSKNTSSSSNERNTLTSQPEDSKREGTNDKTCVNLYPILNKLQQVLIRFNDNLEEILRRKATDAFLLVPFSRQQQNVQALLKNERLKRDVTSRENDKDVGVVQSTTVKNYENTNKNFKVNNVSETSTLDSKTVKDETIDAGDVANDVEVKSAKESSDHINEDASKKIIAKTLNQDSNSVKPIQSGRRFNNEYEDRESVKLKLLSITAQNYEEVKEKTAPLAKVKKDYGDDKNFKIGYIAASLDSLLTNLDKLREEMALNKYVWDDKKVLNLFEKVNLSNSVVGKLMETLKLYTEPVSMLNVFEKMQQSDGNKRVYHSV